MPGFTCSSVGEAVLETGATPVFADVAKDSVNVDAASIAAMITPRTRAAIVAHIFGIPAQMDSLRELLASRGIPVIEDCCQSFGARFNGDLLGTIGSFGTFSFGISKNIAVGAGAPLPDQYRPRLTSSSRMRRPSTEGEPSHKPCCDAGSL
jgi:dTDP-4-amino-4,6-dideoxygalactose transaminase